MANVRALTRGYVGGMIRDMGDEFSWPEGVPVGEWVTPLGVEAAADEAAADEGKPSTAAGSEEGKGKRGRKGKPETVQQATSALFEEPPAPVIAPDGIQAALGGPAPDWLPPSADGAPVMATD